MSTMLGRSRGRERPDLADTTDRAAVPRRRRLGSLSQQPWAVGVSVAITAAAAAGLIMALAMPRGPVTSGQALAGMVVGLVVGVVAGTALRSRWALLLAPAVFVTVFELVRVSAIGPTVDAPRGTVLGIVALIVGRGIDGLLMVVPMLLGATFGCARARRSDLAGPRDHGRIGLWSRRTVTAVATLGMLLLAVGLARPASTEPITGADGRPLEGSIAELATIRVGEHDHTIMLRGEDADAPVLLWLAGGPGGSDIGGMRKAGQRLESAFVVATWDQRGTGKSFASLEPTATMTLEGAVDDTLEVAAYLRSRFGQERIYLAGQSWGTIPGVLAVQRQPRWFHAFVGVGQMVDPLETDRMFYDDSLAYARDHGDARLERRLIDLGPPPYDAFLDYGAGVFSPGGENLWNDYPRVPGSLARSEMPGTLTVPEYSLLEKVRTAGATMDTLAVLYPHIQDLDFRATAATLEVPVYLAQGRYEARGRAELVEQWFAQLDAPHKELMVFERSGHRPMFEEPDRFFEFMTETVLADTAPDRLGADG